MLESPEDFQEINRFPEFHLHPHYQPTIQNLVGGWGGGEGQRGETTSLFTFFFKGLGIYNGQLGLRTSFQGIIELLGGC